MTDGSIELPISSPCLFPALSSSFVLGVRLPTPLSCLPYRPASPASGSRSPFQSQSQVTLIWIAVPHLDSCPSTSLHSFLLFFPTRLDVLPERPTLSHDSSRAISSAFSLIPVVSQCRSLVWGKTSTLSLRIRGRLIPIN